MIPGLRILGFLGLGLAVKGFALGECGERRDTEAQREARRASWTLGQESKGQRAAQMGPEQPGRHQGFSSNSELLVGGRLQQQRGQAVTQLLCCLLKYKDYVSLSFRNHTAGFYLSNIYFYSGQSPFNQSRIYFEPVIFNVAFFFLSKESSLSHFSRIMFF